MKEIRLVSTEIDRALETQQLNLNFLLTIADWNHIRGRKQVFEFSKALGAVESEALKHLLHEVVGFLDSLARDLSNLPRQLLSDALRDDRSRQETTSLRLAAPFPDSKIVDYVAAAMAVFWALLWALKPPTPEELKEDTSICY